MRRSVAHPLAEFPGTLPGCRCSRGARAGREFFRTGPEGRGELGRAVPPRKHVFLVGQHPDRIQPGQVHTPGRGGTLREPPRTLPRLETTRSRPKLLTSSSSSITRPSTTKKCDTGENQTSLEPSTQIHTEPPSCSPATHAPAVQCPLHLLEPSFLPSLHPSCQAARGNLRRLVHTVKRSCRLRVLLHVHPWCRGCGCRIRRTLRKRRSSQTNDLLADALEQEQNATKG